MSAGGGGVDEMDIFWRILFSTSNMALLCGQKYVKVKFSDPWASLYAINSIGELEMATRCHWYAPLSQTWAIFGVIWLQNTVPVFAIRFLARKMP